MKHGLTLLWFALPLVAAAAFGPRYGGGISVGVLELPDSLTPLPPRADGERLALGLVHETLVGLGADGIALPSLAQSWSAAGSGLEWTLRMRSGASFHDGRPVTSADSVRSLRRFLRSDSHAAAHLAGYLEGGPAFRTQSTDELPGLLASDAESVVLRLSQPIAVPLAPLASLAAAVTSASGAAAGPFVPTLLVPGQRLALTAFTAHVRGRPYLDQVQVLAAPDHARLAADLSAARIDAAQGLEGVGAVASSLLLALDAGRPPFDRPGPRAAVAQAIDRTDLVEHFLPGGDPTPALLPSALLAPVGLETRTARAPLGAMHLNMAVGRDVVPLVSQRIVAYLAAAGLSVTVSALSPAQVQAATAPLRLFRWCPEVAEAGLALEELASVAHADPAVLDLLGAAAREPDSDRRRVDLLRAEAALRGSNLLIPVAAAPVAIAARRGLHGLRVDTAGRLILEDAWTEP